MRTQAANRTRRRRRRLSGMSARIVGCNRASEQAKSLFLAHQVEINSSALDEQE